MIISYPDFEKLWQLAEIRITELEKETFKLKQRISMLQGCIYDINAATEVAMREVKDED